MPLEKKLHAVPYFKGLINGKNIFGRQERGSTFTYQKPHWKSSHFTSYRAYRSIFILGNCTLIISNFTSVGTSIGIAVLIDRLISDSTYMYVSYSFPPPFWKFKIGIVTLFEPIYAIRLGLRSGWKNEIKKKSDVHINFEA